MIWVSNKKNILSLKFLKTVSAFLLGIAPFILTIPYLHKNYPGAVFEGARPHLMTWQEFFNPYISSFDPSFLFITGDATPYHSTGKHGMFLLATLPFFILGGYLSLKRGKFWWLILATFILTPLLYGFTGSVHRASGLMAMIPFYSLVAGLGFYELYVWAKNRPLLKILFCLGLILIALNYYDFVRYYWFTYPKANDQYFGKIEVNDSYKILAIEAEKKNLVPYISTDTFKADGEIGKFYVSLYFPHGVNFLDEVTDLPPKASILMTSREDIKGMNRSETSLKFYHLFTN